MKTVKHFVVPGVPWTFGETTEPTAWTETTEGEERDSLEVSRNASGGYSWSIKRYFEAGHEAETMTAIKAAADSLNLEYPDAKKEAK